MEGIGKLGEQDSAEVVVVLGCCISVYPRKRQAGLASYCDQRSKLFVGD